MSRWERSPGVWLIKIYTGLTEEGKQRFETFTFHGGAREAEFEEARLKTLYSRRKRINTNLTVSELCDLYDSNYLEINLRDTTKADYRFTLNKRIKPLLGNIKANNLVPADIQYFIRQTANTRLDNKKIPVSSRTVQNAYRILHAFLEWSKCSGYIDNNAASSVKAPRITKRPPTIMNQKELLMFLSEAKKKSPYYLLYLMASTTGLRQSELLALTWSDIDFDLHTVKINKSKGTDDLTKTLTSNRTIQLPLILIDELSKEGKKVFDKSSLIFPGINPSNLIKRDFKPLLRSIGLSEKIRFHDFRHTHASLLLASGVDMKQISNQLGHSAIGITMDLYTHLLSTDSISKKLDEIFVKIP